MDAMWRYVSRNKQSETNKLFCLTHRAERQQVRELSKTQWCVLRRPHR